MMYYPLPKQIELHRSSIHGYGLFAKQFIPQGTELGVSHVAHELFQHGWIRTPLGAYYNHSENPNCELIDRTLDKGFLTVVKVLQTTKDIKKGVELTCIYTLWKATSEMKGNSE